MHGHCQSAQTPVVTGSRAQACPHWQRLLSMREARAVFEPRMHPVADVFEAALQPHDASMAPGATWQDAHTLYQAILGGTAPQAHLVRLLHASLRSLTLAAPQVRPRRSSSPRPAPPAPPSSLAASGLT